MWSVLGYLTLGRIVPAAPSRRSPRRRPRAALAAVLLPVVLLVQQGPPREIRVPSPDIGVETLQARHRAQLANLDRFDVFRRFEFVDRVDETGITFEHRITDDSGKHYRPDHYDHGNSVNVADVDGDGLLDLYFPNQIGANELWRNRGDGTFEDITERAGVGLADRVSVAAAFGDVDNDDDDDLFVTTVRMGNALFENDGTGRFRDISEDAGVAHVGHSSGTVLFDYDRDGLLDIFVTNVGVYTTDERGAGGYFIGVRDAFQGHLMEERFERSILYRNLGENRFADVTESVGLVDESFSGDATFTDLNRDGRPDLYVLNMQGDDHYWEQDADGFVDRTTEYFPKTPWGAMGIAFFDANLDGRMDLFVTDMHSDMLRDFAPEEEHVKPVVTDATAAARTMPGYENNILGNAFYRNAGDGTFEEISDANGTENYWPWGVTHADLNADGWEDLFIASSMNYPYRYGVNSLLLNNRGGQFLDAEFLLGVEPRKDRATKTPWFELDCSGADADDFHCEERSGRIAVHASLGSRSSVAFDLEGDGDLDLVTGDFNSPPQVLVSDLAARVPLRYLQVELVGTESNRDGLGARVEVETAGITRTRFHDGKSGYLAQSSAPLYFGLGDAMEIDRVQVTWPSGRTQTVEGPLETNRTLRIVEETTTSGSAQRGSASTGTR